VTNVGFLVSRLRQGLDIATIINGYYAAAAEANSVGRVNYVRDDDGWFFDMYGSDGAALMRLRFYLLNLPTDTGLLCATVYASDPGTDAGAWVAHSVFDRGYGDGTGIVTRGSASAIWDQSTITPATTYGY
jgi:hypothetical protein